VFLTKSARFAAGEAPEGMARRKPRPIPTKDLRTVRRQQGLTLRDVYEKSLRIAKQRGRKEFVIPPSRLHEFELQGIVPSIFRIYTLAHVYKHSLRSVLSWYGIPKS